MNFKSKPITIYAKKLHDLLPSALKENYESRGIFNPNILLNWHNIVGEENRDSVKLIRIKQHKNHLQILIGIKDISIWSQWRFIENDIIKKIEEITKKNCKINKILINEF